MALQVLGLAGVVWEQPSAAATHERTVPRAQQPLPALADRAQAVLAPAPRSGLGLSSLKLSLSLRLMQGLGTEPSLLGSCRTHKAWLQVPMSRRLSQAGAHWDSSDRTGRIRHLPQNPPSLALSPHAKLQTLLDPSCAPVPLHSPWSKELWAGTGTDTQLVPVFGQEGVGARSTGFKESSLAPGLLTGAAAMLEGCSQPGSSAWGLALYALLSWLMLQGWNSDSHGSNGL